MCGDRYGSGDLIPLAMGIFFCGILFTLLVSLVVATDWILDIIMTFVFGTVNIFAFFLVDISILRAPDDCTGYFGRMFSLVLLPGGVVSVYVVFLTLDVFNVFNDVYTIGITIYAVSILGLVATYGVASACSNSDAPGYEDIKSCRLRHWYVTEMTICYCPLPRDGACAACMMPTITLWCLVWKLLMLWQFGFLPTHHGIIIRFVNALDGYDYAAVDHSLGGQRVAYFTTEAAARVSLFEGYSAREEATGGRFKGLTAPPEGWKRWRTRVIPAAERVSFRELLNTPYLHDEYNVLTNNCQQWAQRVWVHFGGTVGWTGLY